ncbi:intradiol ring-cleavage dioxygenase [Ramlibacter sp. AN1015]|uniref:intradiol ring-cleavage dioxygenase n=1 Tax=Ramlibacter sp. AN1015 TaxID=3133428 RepID=UPI0030C11983
MAEYAAQDLAQAVIDRMADAPNPRFKEVMSALVKHAHAFVREVQLTPDEWMQGIQFLTQVGQMCDEKRQEFILLSDTLGISMLVVAIDQARGAAARTPAPDEQPPTEATVLGPFYWEGAPELAAGADIAEGAAGEPAWYHGRVTDTAGRPVANAALDVWSGDAEGFYDLQKGADAPMQLRARFRTDADGRYSFWSIKPTYYPVPADGPVGKMLRGMGRHPNRPGHMHTMLQAEGHQTLVTHLFDADSPYIDSDAVFGVRNSLIVDFGKHAPGTAPDGRVLNKTWYDCAYDFRLVPAA